MTINTALCAKTKMQDKRDFIQNKCPYPHPCATHMTRKRSIKGHRHEVHTLTLKEVCCTSMRFTIIKDRNLRKRLDIVVQALDIRVWETKTECQ